MPSKTLFTFFLLAGIAAPPGVAQVKDANPVPAPQDYSKEAFVIERYSTRIVEEEDGSGVRELTAEVKMLADAGVKAFAVLNFTYTSANEVVDIDYVRVRKPDGTVVKTPDYNIQDMPGEVTRIAPLYSDIHEKHVAVRSLAVGDVLEYLVHLRVIKSEVPGHFWFEYSFRKNAIIKDERLEISVPADKYVKVVSPDFKPEVTSGSGRRIYHWVYSNLEVKEKDPNEVPRRTPPNPSVQVTTFANWEDVGRWYGSLQKEPLQVTPAIRAKAADLTRGLQTDDEKIHAIYDFVSLRFHYIGLDFGIGRYQPHAAEDVLENGYGDCKDKHTLLASLLKAAGYEAWPVLIHNQRKLDPEVPSPAQFNHVITVIPMGNKFTWLDTTPEVAPYGLLLLTLRDKQALAIPTSKPPLLMTTPQNPPFPQEQEFSMKGKLTTDGTFTGHAEQSYRGDTEVLLRSAFRQLPQSQWKEAVQRFSYGLNFGGDVSNITVTPPEELEKPFQLSYDYVRKNYADWEHRQIVLPLPPTGVEVTKYSRDQKPSEPVLLGALGKLDYRARVELPPGYSIVTPTAVNLIEPYAEYHTTNVVEDGVLTTNRQFEVKKNEVALSEWEAFRKFGKAVADDEFNMIQLNASSAVVDGGAENGGDNSDEDVDNIFRRGTQALQRRDFTQAQKAFETVIAKEPTHGQAHLDLGLALGAQNKFFDAMAAFRKEEEISPDDSRAYMMAAALANGHGQENEATEELKKLLKVNPENGDAAADLSQLLNQAGKYQESAQVLENAIKTAPNSATLQYGLGSTYLKMGESEKAVTHMRAAVEVKSGNTMMLNNVAYTLAENKTNLVLARQYGEEALRQLDARSAEDVENIGLGTEITYQFSLTWDTVGWIYFQSGEMNQAESFVHASWVLGQDPLVGEHLGEIYEKEGKPKEAARLYELALAAAGTPPFGIPGTSNPRQTLISDITSHYQKLTGKKPSINESWRLPNGDWSKSITEQLSQMRATKFGKQPNLSGSAEFTIVFAPGKVESVKYVSGEQSLQALTDKIKAAHYQVEFPTGSQARILRRAELSCFPTSGCMAVLLPTDRARIREGPSQN